MTERNLARFMIFGALILFLGMLTWFFQGALERQLNPNNKPQSSSTGAVDQVVLKRNRSAHYVANGYLNDHRVRFLVDTGATDVALSQLLARRMNLKAGSPVMLSTANGVTKGYRTTIERVALGNIQLENIPAVVSGGIDEDVVLLGMSFLKHLELIQRDGTLILRRYQ